MDKVAIFAEITRRNALRREAGLPLLDVAVEHRHAVTLAERAEFRAICNQHSDLFGEIHAAVTQELRVERGNPLFGNCMGSRIMIQKIAVERFYVALELRGYREPSGGTRNAI